MTVEQELLTAASRCVIDDVIRLLDQKAQTEASDEFGRTPICLVFSSGSKASRTQKVEVADLLIHHGANVNARDRSGTTPLTYAALLGSLEGVDILLRAGAEPDALNILQDNGCSGGYSALHYPVANGHVGIVRRLIRSGANVNINRAHDKSPIRPLDLALRTVPVRNRESIIDVLQKAGGRKAST